MKYQFVIPRHKQPITLEGTEPIGALWNAGYRAGKMNGAVYVYDKDYDKWEKVEWQEMK